MTKRLVGMAFGLALVCACSKATPAAPDAADRGAVFDRYWSDFDRTYPSFPLKGIDWRAQRDVFRTQAIAAASTAELIEVLRTMAGLLRDGHAQFVSTDGTTHATWSPTAEVNWDRTQWLASLPSIGFVQVRPNLGYATLTGGIGYVVLGSWNTTQFSGTDADAVLDRFRNAPGLILDVRMNGGGDDRLAFDVAGRFLTAARSAGTVRRRSGAGYADLGAPSALTASPRGVRLSMPVMLLTGRGVFSSNESFVDAMRQEPAVTTIGDTTGGSSGNPAVRPLVDGWRYTVPTWQHLASDGLPIEGRGIAPERYVAWDAEAARSGRDRVLEAAHAALQMRLNRER